jgi:hypothetical protein
MTNSPRHQHRPVRGGWLFPLVVIVIGLGAVAVVTAGI